MSDERSDPRALEIALKIADGHALAPTALDQLDPRLARGLGRLAVIVKQCLGDVPADASWGHLRDLRAAGSGSYGEVFRAYDPTLDRDVALKLKRVDADGVFASGRDFVAEAQRLARVRHPNVLAVHGASFHRDRAGLWADWIDGETLRTRLEREQTLAEPDLWRLAGDLAAALAAVHASGLTHGDLKPANIMLDRAGRAVLMDFGASFFSDDAGAALVIGTPRYLAPEVVRGQRASAAVDLYALGVVLFRAASGAYPTSPADLARIRSRPLRALLRRLLADHPAQRPSASGVIALVAHRDAAPLRRARWFAVAVAMLALASIAVIATLAYRRADLLRAQAQQAQASSERASRFLTELLMQGSPDALGPSASLRDLLDAAPRLAEAQFVDDPSGRAMMLGTLAGIESGLANDERAAVLAREAAAAAAHSDPDAAATLLVQSRALVLAAVAGDADAALVAHANLFDRVEKRADASRLRPRLLVDLAQIEHRAWLRDTRPELREREREHLMAALAQAAALDADTEVDALRRLGSLQLEQGGYRDGVATLRQALQRVLATHGANHAETALTRRMLAWHLLHDESTFAESATLFRDNLDRHAAKLGPNGRTVIDDQFGLAHALSLQGRHRDALPLAEHAWQVADKTYGEGHRTTLDVGLTYAAVLEGDGRLRDARKQLELLRERIARLWSVDTRHYVMVTQQLAVVLQRLHEPGADALFADCAERAERLLGAENPLARQCDPWLAASAAR